MRPEFYRPEKSLVGVKIASHSSEEMAGVYYKNWAFCLRVGDGSVRCQENGMY